VEVKMSLRQVVKHGLALAASATGALALLRTGRRARGARVHLFGYHRVVPDPSEVAPSTIGPLAVSSRTFAEHLDHLARRYAVWPIEDALELLAGARPPPERDVAVITFDDGYRDVLEHAAPLLAERRLPATVYVTSACTGTGRPLPHDRLFALIRRARVERVRVLGTPAPDRLQWPLARADFALSAGDPVSAADALLNALPMDDLELVSSALAARLGEPGPGELAPLLDWRDLEELSAMGVRCGAHGVTHTHLPLEDDDRVVEEVAGSRLEIARHLGSPPSTFSYPAGRYDARALEAARAAGYLGALTTEDRRNRPGDDLFRLGRKVMCEEHGVGLFGQSVPALAAAQLDGLFTTLGLSRVVPGDRGPESPWHG
jgi:peptidoglycan/xylan/chitin deacetylase (PgdA/CDA1 family)